MLKIILGLRGRRHRSGPRLRRERVDRQLRRVRLAALRPGQHARPVACRCCWQRWARPRSTRWWAGPPSCTAAAPRWPASRRWCCWAVAVLGVGFVVTALNMAFQWIPRSVPPGATFGTLVLAAWGARPVAARPRARRRGRSAHQGGVQGAADRCRRRRPRADRLHAARPAAAVGPGRDPRRRPLQAAPPDPRRCPCWGPPTRPADAGRDAGGQRDHRHPERRRRHDRPDPKGTRVEAGLDVKVLPSSTQLLTEPRRDPRHPRRQPDRRPGPQPARHRRRRDRRLPHRASGAGHRRRRLDRLRAVPPDPPLRPGRADDARPRRVRPARACSCRSTAARCSTPTTSSCATSATAAAVHESSHERRPEVVFHAAALKHLPMLEQYPAEAVKTNIVGHPDRAGGRRARRASSTFVNISTDKAANPSSVLGYSKRIAEGITALGQRVAPALRRRCASATCSAAAARCSTAFAKQIADGGPITVTAPRRHPLLHDHRGGLPAGHPGGRDRRRTGRLWSSTWASPCGSSTSPGS